MKRIKLLVFIIPMVWGLHCEAFSEVPQYVVQELGVVLKDINNMGHVIGRNNYRQCFIWQNGTYLYLNEPGEIDFSGYAINNYGQVAGITSSFDAAVWDSGTVTNIGKLPGRYYAEPADINDLTQVVGWSSHFIPGIGPDAGHATLWQDGQIVDLGTLGGQYSQAYAINNSSRIVGRAQLPNSDSRPFLWQDGQMINLGLPFGQEIEGVSTWASDINDKGQVLVYHGYICDNGIWTDIGSLGGGWTGAEAINNLGWVVGRSLTTEGTFKPFLYKDGVMCSLDSLISPDSNWRLIEAHGINDQGWIVGYGSYKDEGDINRKGGAYLLIPVPEPSSVFALGLAMFGTGLGWVRRKKK